MEKYEPFMPDCDHDFVEATPSAHHVLIDCECGAYRVHRREDIPAGLLAELGLSQEVA